MSRKRYGLILALVCSVVLIVPTQGQSEPSEQKTGDVATFDLPGGATIEMVWIEPGTFMMGSPENEPERYENEGPQHEVTISHGFWLGRYELSQGQWESVMGTHPWQGEDYVYVVENPNHPAVYISWDDMQEFISKSNQAEGTEIYRLPTEAEWEYACRAGTTTRWSLGENEVQLKEYAWYSVNAWDLGEQYAHAVGMKLPNPWGLYDIHGNVFEWCQDQYGLHQSGHQVDPTGPSTSTNYVRVLRGGSFQTYALYARSAYRNGAVFDLRIFDFGARLLRQEHATSVSPSTWGRIKSLLK